MKKLVLLATILIVLGSFPIHMAFADGSITWSKDKDIAADDLNHVLFADNKFVLVGNNGTIKTSYDGTKWDNMESGTTNNLQKILYLKNSFIVVGDKGTILTSPDGTNWNSVQSGVDSNLNGIANNGDTVVIVGGNGTILSSKNNTNWVVHSIDDKDVTLESVTWYKNQFVAVGSHGYIATSSDCNIWTSRKSGTDVTLFGITSNNEELVAVGGGGYRRESACFRITYGATVTSKDGVTWIAKEYTSNNLLDVKWIGNEFIAVGGRSSYMMSSDILPGKVFTSKNGVDWSETEISNSFNLKCFVTNGSSFVAVGYWGKIIRSSDRVNWDIVSKSIPSDSKNIACNGKTFIMADIEGNLFTSDDGSIWVKKALEDIDSRLKSNVVQNIKWTGKEFIATVPDESSPNVFFLTSVDGYIWSVFNIPGYQSFRNIMCGSHRYWVFGDNETMLNSIDGVNWDGINFSAKNANYRINNIAYNGNIYIAVESTGDYGNCNNILYSYDGVNWKRNAIQKNGPIYDITWNGKIFVAVGKKELEPISVLEDPKDKPKKQVSKSDETKGIILTSYDGINWSRNEPEGAEALQNVKWNGSMFIAVGENGYICTSSDGLNWCQQLTPTKNTLWNIAWNDKKTIVIGSCGTVLECDLSGQKTESFKAPQLNQHQYVPDIKWSKIQEEKGVILNDVAWNGKKFLAVGMSLNDGIILSSLDGIKWDKNYTSNLCRYSSIIWNGDMFLVGGEDLNKNSCITLASSDGNSWATHDLGIDCNINKIAWNGKTFVASAYGDPNRILSSNDGINWSSEEVGRTYSTYGAYWNGSMFIVFNYGMSNSEIYSSRDGYVWDKKDSAYLLCGNIAKNNKTAVLVGGTGQIFTTEDFQNWSKQTCPTYSSLNGVVWDGNEFVAVGTECKGVVSTSGFEWSKVDLPSKGNVNKIVWNGEKLITVGEEGTILSGIPSDMIKVKINDTPIIFDVSPKLINDRTLVPLRSIFEALNAKVDWDDSTKTIKGANGNTVVLLTIGKNEASVNGVTKSLDTPALIIDGRTLVPARFIAESFGAEVNWDKDTKTIIIKTKQPN